MEETVTNAGDDDSDTTSNVTEIEVKERRYCQFDLRRNFCIFVTLIAKSCLTVRRLWLWILGLYVVKLLLLLMTCIILRKIYPFQLSEVESKTIYHEIGPDWVMSATPTEGVVFIGYAPRFPIIEALMEEAERILHRNGLPDGIREFQTVPFDSEYSMERFIKKRHGVLQYAFAFSVPGTTYPKLLPVLDIISYIDDIGPCYKQDYPPCPGNVYISKVIMEAFINAHSRKENNITLSYRLINETFQRYDNDPILKELPVDILAIVFICLRSTEIWIFVYVLALERENIELTLHRMGISLGLNYAANVVVLTPLLLLGATLTNIPLSVSYFGSYPIIEDTTLSLRIFGMFLSVLRNLSYLVLGSVIFEKGGVRWENMNANLHWKNEVASPLTILMAYLILIPIHLGAAVLIVFVKNQWASMMTQNKLLNWIVCQNTAENTHCERRKSYREALPGERLPLVVFEHIDTKETPDGVALRDINWVLGRGEVTVAMGLENSGSSRLLSVLYGDVKPHNGKATAFGLDCAEKSKYIRRNLGVSQRALDHLFMNLTVRDNFWLFSRLRYYSNNRERYNVDELIEDAGLKEVLDLKLSELRLNDLMVLNVALAFVGDSALVVLEDPTQSGDIHFKRRVWRLIRTHSKGRTVLITTMSMAEAQTIGDRISIFLDGSMYCSGSVHYVKEIFGTGYLLEIEKMRNFNKEAAVKLVLYYFKDCSILEDSKHKLVILLPSRSEENGRYETLLNHLEQAQEGLKIANYDLSGSTLESAFVNLTSLAVDSNVNVPKNDTDNEARYSFGNVDQHKTTAKYQTPTVKRHSSLAAFSRSYDHMRGSIKVTLKDLHERETHVLGRRKGLLLYWSRFLVMLEHRFLVSSRHMWIDAFQVLTIILLVLNYNNPIQEKWHQEEKVIDHRLKEKLYCPSEVAISSVGGTRALEQDVRKRTLWKILRKTVESEIDTTCSSLLDCLPANGTDSEYLEKCIRNNAIHRGLLNYGIKLTPQPGQLLNAVLYVSRTTPGKSLAPAMTAAMESFLRFTTNDGSMKYQIHNRAVYPFKEFLEHPIVNLLAAEAFLIFLRIPYKYIYERISGGTLVQQISGASPIVKWTTAFCTDTVTSLSLSGVFFLASQYAMPMYPTDQQTDYLIEVVILHGSSTLVMIYFFQRFFHNTIFGTIVILFGTFVTAHLVNSNMQHNSMESTHTEMLFIPGFFAFEHLKELVNCYYEEKYCPEHIERDCSKSNEYTYLCCHGRRAHGEHNHSFFLWVGVAQLIFWTCLLYLSEYRIYLKPIDWARKALFPTSTKKHPAKADIASLTPSVNSVYSFKNILASQTQRSVSQLVHTGSLTKGNVYLSKSNSTGSLSALSGAAEAVGKTQSMTIGQVKGSLLSTGLSEKMTLSSSVDASFIPPGFRSVKFSQNQLQAMDSDNFGVKVSELTAQEKASREEVLIIDDMTKSRMFFNVSLCVVGGEIFNFVCTDNQVNSEILRCIAGVSRCDGGRVSFKGKPFGWRHPMSSITVGYSCKGEMYNSRLSPRETLTVHCTLRGVVEVDAEVDRILKVLNLTEVADMAPKELSEGTLARFRIAIALVGEPDIILLDQPLASQDSVGKVSVFKAIDRARKRGKMIIMTGNSLDECDDLASRVAIVVKGRVLFVSTPKGVRDRFSNSYSLTARLGSDDQVSVNILLPSLMQRFPQAEIFVDRLNYLHILLPYRTESLTEIFRLMASVEKHLMVTDFVLSHTTVDNVLDALEKEGQI